MQADSLLNLLILLTALLKYWWDLWEFKLLRGGMLGKGTISFKGKAWQNCGREGKRDPGSNLAEMRNICLQIKNWYFKACQINVWVSASFWVAYLLSSASFVKMLSNRISLGRKNAFVLLFLFYRVCGGESDGWRTVSVPTATVSHLALIKEIQVGFADKALLSCIKPSQ